LIDGEEECRGLVSRRLARVGVLVAAASLHQSLPSNDAARRHRRCRDAHEFNIDVARDDDFRKLIAELDPDGSGGINYEELLGAFGQHIAGARDGGKGTLQATASATAQQRAVRAATAARSTSIDMRDSSKVIEHKPPPPMDKRAVRAALAERLSSRGPKVAQAFLWGDEDRSGTVSRAEVRSSFVRTVDGGAIGYISPLFTTAEVVTPLTSRLAPRVVASRPS